MIRYVSTRRRLTGERGFTLVELLVVIVILGILSGVVVLAVSGIDDRGDAAAFQADLRAIEAAQEAHCAKFGRYASEAALVNTKLLATASSLNDVELTSSGTCGPEGTYGSGYRLGTSPTATVTVAANADRWHLNDTNSGPDYDSSHFAYPLNSNIYDPLIIMGSDYTLQPGLASSWELIPVGDPRKPTRPYPNATWRFHLRQGVTFHDGSDFDADDVVWTWRDRQPLNRSPLSTVTDTLGFSLPLVNRARPGGDPDSVEKIDQFTVDFTPKVANLRLPEQIVHPKGAILPATGLAPAGTSQPVGPAGGPAPTVGRLVGLHMDGTSGGYPGRGAPVAAGAATPIVPGPAVGTGPFEYVSWAQGVDATMVANDEYWGERAQVQQMDYTFIADASTRTAGLLSGQYDLVIDLDAVAVAPVQAAGKTAVSASYGQNSLLYVNKVVKDSPSGGPRYDIGTDRSVRRAISYALDRTTYVNSVYDGQAAPGRWMGPPDILGTHQSVVPPMAYDKVKAAALLDAAGWTCGGGAADAGTPCGPTETRVHVVDAGPFSGRKLALKLIGPPDVPQTGYDLIVAQLKAVGIDVTAIRYATAGERSVAYNSSLWDLDLEVPNQNDANPAFLPTLRFACSRSGTLRFSPSDGTRAVTNPVNDSAGNGGGVFPFGNTPCETDGTRPGVITPATLGPFDATYVPAADQATTQNAAQNAAAHQMRILVGQDETSVVIPLNGQYRIYGLGVGVGLGDPHPSQTSQRWVTLTKS